MLTIKHVTDGGETILQASETNYLDGQSPTSVVAEQLMYLDGKEWKSIRFGIAYVMNEAGRTVATYNMNPVANSAIGVGVGIAATAADQFQRHAA